MSMNVVPALSVLDGNDELFRELKRREFFPYIRRNLSLVAAHTPTGDPVFPLAGSRVRIISSSDVTARLYLQSRDKAGEQDFYIECIPGNEWPGYFPSLWLENSAGSGSVVIQVEQLPPFMANDGFQKREAEGGVGCDTSWKDWLTARTILLAQYPYTLPAFSLENAARGVWVQLVVTAYTMGIGSWFQWVFSDGDENFTATSAEGYIVSEGPWDPHFGYSGGPPFTKNWIFCPGLDSMWAFSDTDNFSFYGIPPPRKLRLRIENGGVDETSITCSFRCRSMP